MGIINFVTFQNSAIGVSLWAGRPAQDTNQ